MKEQFKKKTEGESGGGAASLGGSTWYGVDKLLFVRLGAAVVLLCLGLFLRLGEGISLLLLLLSTLISGFDVLYRACVRLVKEHCLGEELLVSIAAILAFTINEGYEAAAVMLIYQAGYIIRSYASALTKSSFRDHVDPYVPSVTVLRGGEKTAISPEEVQLGDILILERGQRAPAKFWKAPPRWILPRSSDIPPGVKSQPDKRSPQGLSTAAPPSVVRRLAPRRTPFLRMQSALFPIRTLCTVPKPIPWSVTRASMPRSLSASAF